MNKRDLTKIRKLLEKIKSELLQTFDYDLNVERQADEIDQSIELVTKQFNQTLRARNAAYLKKIDQTLKRIASPTFGICGDCEEDISVQRLLIRPTADLCTPCQEMLEFKKTKVGVTNQTKVLRL